MYTLSQSKRSSIKSISSQFAKHTYPSFSKTMVTIKLLKGKCTYLKITMMRFNDTQKTHDQLEESHDICPCWDPLTAAIKCFQLFPKITKEYQFASYLRPGPKMSASHRGVLISRSVTRMLCSLVFFMLYYKEWTLCTISLNTKYQQLMVSWI